MSFNDNIRLDPTRVGTSGAGRKVAGVGGGSLLGLLLVLGFSYVTGIDLTSLLSSPSASSPSSSTVDVSTCRTGADANARVECRMVATAQSLDQVWKTQLTQQGTNVAYELPDFQIFTNSVSTACGNATSAVGPFYCPGDSTVYLDLGFFDDMVTKYGASDSVLAQEYVVAHEWGHHIQNLQGVFRAHDTRETGEQGAGVRSELQADCYAGVWMHWASTTRDPATGACKPGIRERQTRRPGPTEARTSVPRGSSEAWTRARSQRATPGALLACESASASRYNRGCPLPGGSHDRHYR